MENTYERCCLCLSETEDKGNSLIWKDSMQLCPECYKRYTKFLGNVSIDAMLETIKNNYIPTNKIREKIEELKKLIIEAHKELGSASKEYTIYVYQKDILQNLLEENK